MAIGICLGFGICDLGFTCMDKSHSPKIYGLIGYPVKHSLSPEMHNAAFRALKINAEYRLFEIKSEDLEDFLLKNIPIKDTKGENFFSQDIMGFNITIPHKVKAREILEKEFPYNQDAVLIQDDLYYVKLSGAINTVKRTGTKLEYWNTDAPGFFKALTQKGPLCLDFDPKGKTIFVIGCGGAGRAVIAGLGYRENASSRIYIYDNNKKVVKSTQDFFSKFEYLKDKLEFILAEDIPKVIKNCDLLVNASPVGMKEDDGSVIDRKLLHQDLYVYDVVYNRKTQLIKDAESLGLPAIGGLGMLLYQGVDAFNLWTGQKAPVEGMRKALIEAVSK